MWLMQDEWERRSVKKGQEYAALTDIITQGWAGMTTREYNKRFKGLKPESLRGNMTNLERVLNMLAEATTTEISKEKKRGPALPGKIFANILLLKEINRAISGGYLKRRDI